MDWTLLTGIESLPEAVIRICLAGLLGALVGIEREIHGRPAGFRTHLLVAIGACLMMLVSEHFYFKYQSLASDSVLRLDPARVAAQIVTGIGFLGAGAIIKESHSVRGLTTAACLWVVAGIGMAVGCGMYLAALLVTAVALFSLLLLKRIERLVSRERYRVLEISCDDQPDTFETLLEFLQRNHLRLVDCGVEREKASSEVNYRFVVSQFGQVLAGPLTRAVLELKGVNRVRLR